jgi:hypothetical protein
MSRYIHAGSFGPPAERTYPDGRQACDRALKKIFARGPTRPDSLAKRAKPDSDVNDERAMALDKRERRLRSNAHEALQEIRKVHAAGGRRSLPESEGGAPQLRKSIEAMRKALQRGVYAGNRLPSAVELNRSFANGRREVNLDEVMLPLHKQELRKLYADGHRQVTAGRYIYTFDAKGVVIDRQLRKANLPRNPSLNEVGVKPPNSLNATWDNNHADTAAANNWRDQLVPSVRPTIVGAQTVVTPSALTRDAAIDAIKMALRKPQKMWGNSADLDEDQDATEDLDEDEEDLDETEARGKDPNASDSFDGNRKRGKRRADEEE